MKRILFWLLILGVPAGAAAVGYGALSNAYRNWNTTRFRFVEIDRGEIRSVVKSTGAVQPVRKVEVGAFISGPIQLVHVDFNSRVKKGDLLAEIDPRPYQPIVDRDTAVLSVREADVDRNRVLLEQAQRNERRALALRAMKPTFISGTEVDQYTFDRKQHEAQLKLAEAAVAEARANLKQSTNNLGYSKIRAPVDGVIIDKKVDSGQTVASQFQTPVMFVLAPDLETKVHVFASVDEADIGLIRAAQEKKQPVTFRVDAYPQDTFEGKVWQIRFSPTTVQNIVTYTVVVESPNPDLKLLPGMTASLTFVIETHANTLRVPNAALRYYPPAALVRAEDIAILEGATQPADSRSASVPDANSSGSSPTLGKTREKRHVWVAEGEKLRAVEVTTGLADGKFTELVEGDLTEGQPLVSGILDPAEAAKSEPSR